jgi:hypothetical protein
MRLGRTLAERIASRILAREGHRDLDASMSLPPRRTGPGTRI